MTKLCEADVAIIGGGIMGVSISYYLARAGIKSAVLERSSVGTEASGRNGGGVRLQARHPYEIPLALLAVEIWPDLGRELGVETEYRRGGNIWLALNEKELEAQGKLAQVQRELGVDIRILSRSEVRILSPILTGEAFVGASFSPNCGNANPIFTTQGFAAAASRLGASIYQQTEVLGIHTSGGAIQGVHTSRGDVMSPVLVNAAGPWAPQIGRMVGLDIPIRPSRDQLMVTEPLPGLCRQFVISNRVYFRQAVSGGFHIGTVNLPHTTFDRATDSTDLCYAARAFVDFAPGLHDVNVIRSWAGTSEKTPDDIPVLGYVDRPSGFIVAAGFSGHGFALSPAVGRVISELIVKGEPSVSIRELGLSRFENHPEGSPVEHWS